MKTLEQIVSEVRDGGRPEYEELRYAICAMEALLTFNRLAFSKLARAEQEGKKPFLTSSAVWQRDENFNRNNRAYSKPPKEYVGWGNDPDNPEFLKRRKTSIKIMDKMIDLADKV